MVAVKITEMDSHLKLFNCVICVAWCSFSQHVYRYLYTKIRVRYIQSCMYLTQEERKKKDTYSPDNNYQQIPQERWATIEKTGSLSAKGWLEGESVLRKDAQATGMTAALNCLLTSFPRSGLKLVSEYQEPPWTEMFWTGTADVTISRNSWARERTQLLSFQMKVKLAFHLENQGPRVWREHGQTQDPKRLKSSVKFLQFKVI